jgi:hypothetical protein
LIVEIQYLTYKQIDKSKWDACINIASNGLLYAYADYLDAMAGNWDALILNDYEAVMPLTWNKKFGIHYLYQPAFTASLGVFGRSVDGELLRAFLRAIPDKFRYCDIYLNHGNLYPVAGFHLYERMNYVLSLNKPYDELSKHYRDNIKRNVKKSEQLQLVINKDIPVKEVILLASAQAQGFSKMTPADFNRFEKLYELLHKRSKATTYGVYNSNAALLASAVFLFSHKRAYYILVGNHPDGKTIGASHALINAFIKDHAGEDLLLDFEGSDISSLAFFYSSFGAVEEKYPALKFNRLPGLVRLFKK